MGPSISVVIPAFNRAHFLTDALRSALAQTHLPNEIIVVDDGSTDDTAALVGTFGKSVTCIRQKNQGPAAARNNGFRSARGDYIALLDSDDIWEVDRLERQVAAIRQHGALDVLFGLEKKYSAREQFDRCEIRDRDAREFLETVDCVIPDALGLLLRENVVPTSTSLFCRKRLDEVGFIDESLTQAEDYDFWLRFAAHGCRFGFINRTLCRRRVHDGNLVNDTLGRQLALVEVLGRFRHASPEASNRVDLRLNDLHYDLGSHLFRRGEFGRALRHLPKVKATGRKRLVLAAKLSVARLLSLNFRRPPIA